VGFTALKRYEDKNESAKNGFPFSLDNLPITELIERKLVSNYLDRIFKQNAKYSL